MFGARSLFHQYKNQFEEMFFSKKKLFPFRFSHVYNNYRHTHFLKFRPWINEQFRKFSYRENIKTDTIKCEFDPIEAYFARSTMLIQKKNTYLVFFIRIQKFGTAYGLMLIDGRLGILTS